MRETQVPGSPPSPSIRAQAATTDVSVSYATLGVTATAGRDYDTKSGTLHFTPGETTKTITVVILGDRIRERDEALLVVLSRASGAKIAGLGAATVTILDDDGASHT